MKTDQQNVGYTAVMADYTIEISYANHTLALYRLAGKSYEAYAEQTLHIEKSVTDKLMCILTLT